MKDAGSRKSDVGSPPPEIACKPGRGGILRHVNLTATQVSAGNDMAEALNVRIRPGGPHYWAAVVRALFDGRLEVRPCASPGVAEGEEERGPFLRWNRRRRRMDPAACRGAKD